MTRLSLFISALLLTSCGHVAPPVEKPREQPKTQERGSVRHRQHKNRSQQERGSAGKFDFYVVSLSWSPQFCASPAGANDRVQCGPGRQYGFVLHGLWPQYEQRGWPQNCGQSRVDRGTVDSMLEIMPSPKLVIHEWQKHGTCSGHDPKEYFEDAREAFTSVRIPTQYQQPRAQVMTSPAELRKRFEAANPAHGENGFAVLCRGRYLSEVRACFTTNFEPRPCNREVLGDQCKQSEIILRPVR